MLGSLLELVHQTVTSPWQAWPPNWPTAHADAAANHRTSHRLHRSLHWTERSTWCPLDVYWVHARDMLTPVEETMRALDDQVRAGKVLYVGVSDWYAWEVAQANTLATLRGWTAFSGLQVPYSLGERTVERELVPMAAQLGLAVTAWSPLGGGRLARGSKDPLVGALKNVAGEIGARATQVAIAWLRRRSGRVIPIIGVSKAEQMRENLGALDIELSTDHLAELDKASSIELGFPGDFLADMQVRDAVYGSHRARIGEGM